jgi:hypothetical protein
VTAVGLNYVVRPPESRLFRQCRRAWDFGARERQDYESAEPAEVFDFGEAIHDALDVYYFPGMWEWKRAIVRPLALAGFEKSMRRQRAAYAHARDLSVEQLDDWEHHMELGAGLLLRYFERATDIDRFTPIQVAAQFDVTVPDPAAPDSGLVTPDGRGIQCRVRIDMAVIDEHQLYWLLEHRIVTDPAWADVDQLRLDEQALTRTWAWQLGFLAKLEGAIHNEVRVAVPSRRTPLKLGSGRYRVRPASSRGAAQNPSAAPRSPGRNSRSTSAVSRLRTSCGR